ncbi:MAG: DUF3301 domain-containing protein [Gammaproteobacteria bacterium]|nr:DUF3301 domain-containing protein [Gammaproteobacteria bacterium]
MAAFDNAILGGLALGTAIWAWQSAQSGREAALAVVHRVCRELAVQPLDQTVTLSNLRFGRDRRGRLTLIRSYEFEFSTVGEDRCRGTLAMAGPLLCWIRLAHPDGAIHIDG